ncbi:tRNA glutamyl-Q(34) synthetase GluQRS [Pseudohaliea rubra]|uniref:Glutamyl-Q tRNA(Asp) synthetase n=1 Tax=Pseudohaliea rubra DSM 19751 TaxID=1265313 RepID=A0A095VNN7_9GAMM|nr:tRNA glutamyl-Q(34) synthetase GluQRS [Pseudohaliea rubra]KGE02713.1 glutamyl-Q-tRNA synthetase [Pseudohaliea rubra DSM 19751]
MTRGAGSYCGRFAPSPTGPLHLGSLLAALASYLDARAHGGRWLLRLEDIDPPREQPGAARAIIASLRAHGLGWDGSVCYQHTRSDAYEDALAALDRRGLLRRCYCPRRVLGPDGACEGRCGGAGDGPAALRVRVDPAWPTAFEDRFQGTIAATPLPADFVVRRRDGLYAYQLAVVVDDHAQGISDVVRGADLLPVTPRQRYLQTCLGYPSPHYGHCPVLLGNDGRKLSKQNHAPGLDDSNAAENLRRGLALLGQPVPPASARAPEQLLQHAVQHWAPAALAGTMALPAARLYPPPGIT